MSSAQQLSQPLTDPTVQGSKHGVLAVLEVFEPAHRTSVYFPDDVPQVSRSAAAGLFAYGCSEFIQALLARPAVATFEVVAQKVEPAFLAGVDNARLGRMQR